MERVIAYIDGFNLYHGTKSAFGRKYLWLGPFRFVVIEWRVTPDQTRATCRRGEESAGRSSEFFACRFSPGFRCADSDCCWRFIEALQFQCDPYVHDVVSDGMSRAFNFAIRPSACHHTTPSTPNTPIERTLCINASTPPLNKSGDSGSEPWRART